MEEFKMLVFEEMLIDTAKRAGIKTPPVDQVIKKTYPVQEYPHFTVFCNIQLCRAMTTWTEHHENADVIVQIPEEQIRKVTMEDLRKKGVQGI